MLKTRAFVHHAGSHARCVFKCCVTIATAQKEAIDTWKDVSKVHWKYFTNGYIYSDEGINIRIVDNELAITP